MEVLAAPIRNSDWGSTTFIAELQDRPSPAPDHEAEMWMGAHPGDPSLVNGRSLVDLIHEDPEGQLGPLAAGGRLPFLAKVLAAQRSLSLQIHPDARQAVEGYAAEEAAGVPVGEMHRRYKDPYAKPEILVAFTPFEALCGFREISDVIELLLPLREKAPQLAPIITKLEASDLEGVVQGLFRDPNPAPFVDAVVAACSELQSQNKAYEIVVSLASLSPGDIGAVVSLLLRHVQLQPGQGIYQPAGMLHSYLGGAGFEVMGASDNTLRAGLTSKHVDVEEVLHLLRYTTEPATIVEPITLSPGVQAWKTQAREFEVLRVDADGAAVSLPPTESPMVILCVEGTLQATDNNEWIELPKGTAAWSPSSAGAVMLQGKGTAFVARVPDL